MKYYILILTLLFSLASQGSIFDKEVQKCVLNEIKIQHQKFFSNSEMIQMIVFADNTDNWEAIVITRYKEATSLSQSFLTLENGNVVSTRLSIEGVISRTVNLKKCL